MKVQDDVCFFSSEIVLKCVSCLRTRDKDLYADMIKPSPVFAKTSDSDFVPYTVCNHSIADPEINCFINLDSFRLSRYLSDLASFSTLVDLVAPAACSQSPRPVGHPFCQQLHQKSNLGLHSVTECLFLQALLLTLEIWNPSIGPSHGAVSSREPCNADWHRATHNSHTMENSQFLTSLRNFLCEHPA